jgi:hypothetical protein
MIWNIAAGVIIGGCVLGLLGLGVREASVGSMQNEPGQIGLGFLMMAAGIGLGAWVLFFKAQFG